MVAKQLVLGVVVLANQCRVGLVSLILERLRFIVVAIELNLVLVSIVRSRHAIVTRNPLLHLRVVSSDALKRLSASVAVARMVVHLGTGHIADLLPNFIHVSDPYAVHGRSLVLSGVEETQIKFA